jgi:hypothetical protein
MRKNEKQSHEDFFQGGYGGLARRMRGYGIQTAHRREHGRDIESSRVSGIA